MKIKNPHRLAKARHLLARVEGLCRSGDVSPLALGMTMGYARHRGAHSVRRALSLLDMPAAIDKYGVTALRKRALDVTKRWVGRVEREAFAGWPPRKTPPGDEAPRGEGRDGSPARNRDPRERRKEDRDLFDGPTHRLPSTNQPEGG